MRGGGLCNVVYAHCPLSMSSCHGARTIPYTFLVRGRNSPTVGALHDVGHHRLSGVWVDRSHQDAAWGVARRGWGWMWLAQGAWMLQQVYRQ